MIQKVYNTKVLYSKCGILRGFGQNGGCILGVSFGYVWGNIWYDIVVDTWTSR